MVRSWWFPIVLAIFALSFGACAHRPPPHSTSGPLAVAQVTPELASVGITVREIAPDVFLAMQQSPNQSSANVLVVRMRDGGVVICRRVTNTPPSSQRAYARRASLRRSTFSSSPRGYRSRSARRSCAYATWALRTRSTTWSCGSRSAECFSEAAWFGRSLGLGSRRMPTFPAGRRRSTLPPRWARDS